MHSRFHKGYRCSLCQHSWKTTTSEELKQTITGIVTQRLVVASKSSESELSAVFEILSDDLLEEAFQSMYIGKTYHIPYQFSLSYQIERGVREGVIEKG